MQRNVNHVMTKVLYNKGTVGLSLVLCNGHVACCCRHGHICCYWSHWKSIYSVFLVWGRVGFGICICNSEYACHPEICKCMSNMTFFISVPAGNIRITTTWGPDENDLGVNELLTDRRQSSLHLNWHGTPARAVPLTCVNLKKTSQPISATAICSSPLKGYNSILIISS